jgi:uncharacterized repeat protein (TIGR03803 family)
MLSRPAVAMLSISLCSGAAAHGSAPIDRIASMIPSRGGTPNGGPAFDASGNVYVTNAGFGTYGLGSIVEFTPPAKGQTKWQARTVWRFAGTGSAGGAQPIAALTPDGKGGFYGTAMQSGAFGFGVVFEIDPAGIHGQWLFTVLWNFTGYHDGGFPVGGVIADATGNLYGTASIGGGGTKDSHPFGVVYQLSPPSGTGGSWQEKTLVRFNNKNGYSPECTLLMNKSGVLFGTTYGGGRFGQGTVFKLTPPAGGGTAWSHAIIHDFANKDDGSSPFAGLIEDAAGNLYGTTFGLVQPGSWGTVFELSPPAGGHQGWTETTLWNFAGGTDGGAIFAGLYADPTGALWGAASDGGTKGHGELFKLTPPAKGTSAWTKTDVGDFTGADGANPIGTLALGPDGNLYGTASSGGAENFGTAFRITP